MPDSEEKAPKLGNLIYKIRKHVIKHKNQVADDKKLK